MDIASNSIKEIRGDLLPVFLAVQVLSDFANYRNAVVAKRRKSRQRAYGSTIFYHSFMANMPSFSASDNYYYGSGYPVQVPDEQIDLSALPELVGFADEWSVPYDRSVVKSESIPRHIPSVPKPEPDFGGLPDLETNLPQHLWFASGYNPQMAGSYSNNPPMLQLSSQPPTPAAECQVTSSGMSPVSPFSPHSDVSFEERCQDGSPVPFPPGSEPAYEVDVDAGLGDLKLGGMTEEQLVSLSARDLNRICRDVPEDVIKQLKKRRRTLKNRGYAYNSRVRRVSQKNVLEKERDDLRQQIQQLTERYKLLERERDSWKRRAQSIEKAEV